MTDRPEDIIDCMARMKGDGQPFALATVVRTEDATAAKAGAKAVVRADGAVTGWVGGGCTLGAVRKAAARALADGQARLVRVRPNAAEAAEAAAREAPGVELHGSRCPSGGTIEVFVEPILPRPSLIVAGASPTARALADLGRRGGFAVTVAARAEDQAAFAEADFRIEGFDLSAAPRPRDGYVVVATQGKGDREALAAALAGGAPYVAFVGSRRKAEALKAAMREAGVPEARIAALHAPAGLDIGAATPEEIAISILAEIVEERRREFRAAPPSVESEEIEGGSFESRVVSPVLGACRGNDGQH
jgi:xanthine dehydrogenase accessory factor